VLTYILAVVGLAAFLGGGLTCLGLLVMWGMSRRAASSTPGRQTGKGPHSDEVSSEAGWSEVSSGQFIFVHLLWLHVMFLGQCRPVIC
jgi:hypothetical protein